MKRSIRGRKCTYRQYGVSQCSEWTLLLLGRLWVWGRRVQFIIGSEDVDEEGSEEELDASEVGSVPRAGLPLFRESWYSVVPRHAAQQLK